MIARDYLPLGGRHWDTAAMRNTLAHAGVVSPQTGELEGIQACADDFRKHSIETAGAGLFRPMYASFLDDAAEISGRGAFAECAERYRRLDRQGSELAEAALPERITPLHKEQKTAYKTQEIIPGPERPHSCKRIGERWRQPKATYFEAERRKSNVAYFAATGGRKDISRNALASGFCGIWNRTLTRAG